MVGKIQLLISSVSSYENYKLFFDFDGTLINDITHLEYSKFIINTPSQKPIDEYFDLFKKYEDNSYILTNRLMTEIGVINQWCYNNGINLFGVYNRVISSYNSIEWNGKIDDQHIVFNKAVMMLKTSYNYKTKQIAQCLYIDKDETMMNKVNDLYRDMNNCFEEE